MKLAAEQLPVNTCDEEFQESRMPGNPLVRFDEGRVGRTARCRPLSYSTASVVKTF
jgi:hypothetical protein